MQYLVFRLYGAMASWGDIAVGGVRRSANYPSKSAVCGLLAAALGIDRSEDAIHQSIGAGYLQAVKMLNAGQLLRDYHTVQAPRSVGKFRYRTRRDELVVGKDYLGTVLSSREYRTDAQAVVALQLTEHSPYTLQELQQALCEPIFHLYLGRKSCPLSVPLDPQLIETNNFKTALDSYKSKVLLNSQQTWESETRWLKHDCATHYYWEGDIDSFSHEEGFVKSQVQRLTRHDKLLSRQRWQFQPRTEYMWLTPTTQGAN